MTSPRADGTPDWHRPLGHTPAGATSTDTAQTPGMQRREAISGRLSGSDRLWMGETRIAPGRRSSDHHHGESETGIYVRSGHPVFVFADGGEERRVETGPGDYVFVPPWVPHREENPGGDEAVVVLARTTQEAIVVNLPGLRAAPTVTYRPAGAADVDAVVALVEAAYRGDSSRTGWTTEADLLDGGRTYPEAVRANIEGGESMVLLAEEGGELVACCHLAERPGSVAYFGMFAVRPGRQGGGVGRAVLGEATRLAVHRWGSAEMRMTVIRQREDLIAWYRRLGFEPTGETEPFPYGDERYGRPRRDDLEFTVLAKPIG